jgi:hypothetical protein
MNLTKANNPILQGEEGEAEQGTLPEREGSSIRLTFSSRKLF